MAEIRRRGQAGFPRRESARHAAAARLSAPVRAAAQPGPGSRRSAGARRRQRTVRAQIPGDIPLRICHLRTEQEREPADSEVYALDVASNQLTPLTDRRGPDSDPAVSPDGRLIAYTGFDDQRLGLGMGAHGWILPHPGEALRWGRSVSGKGCVGVFYWFLKWVALGPLLRATGAVP